MEESTYYHINFKHILKNTQCLFFNKDVREFNEERTVFSTNGARAAGYPYTKDSYLKPYTKINS